MNHPIALPALSVGEQPLYLGGRQLSLTPAGWLQPYAALLFRGAHHILRETKKAPQKRGLKNALALFYFPTQIYAVSSTMEGLTAEFGMGSGVPPPP